MLRVVFDPAYGARVLFHGETRHGMQSNDPLRSREPLSYYHRDGPLGDIFASWSPPANGAHVGIVGLGAGCIAAYARPGQRFTFYEVDPRVVKIATDPQYFTYLSQCRGTFEIVLGDGLESLAKAPDRTFDMIILDAFQDAAIPLHLVSPEAVGLYLRKLTTEGLLVFHINTHGGLLPELTHLAAQQGSICLFRADVNVGESEQAAGRLQSFYVVLARAPASVATLSANPRWTMS